MKAFDGLRLRWRNFSEYGRELGWRSAVQLALRGSDATCVLRLTVSGLPFAVHCRNTLADLAVIRAVLGRKESFVPLDARSCIIDCGAHIGCTSLVYAARFPHVRILAVEPNLANYEMLRRNAASYPNLIPIHGACWPQRTQVRIMNPTAPSVSFRVSASGAAELPPVEAYPIRELLQLAGANRCDLLKIDIEGAEFELFRDTPAEDFDLVGTFVIEIHEGMRPGATAVIKNALPESKWTWVRQAEYTIVSRRTEVPG